MTQPFLTITPLGGLGEIGLNCQLWTSPAGSALVDCGLMFPDDLQLGVDIVIPRLEPILACQDNLLGIILTHGHEDHIGAVPWLASFIKNLTIYGSPFTLSLVEHKLKEKDLWEQVRLVPVSARDIIDLGDLRFHFLPVTHSIPQGYALAVETPIGKVIHTGDFKIDTKSRDKHTTDLESFKKFAGKKGVRLLMSDSTNVEEKGHSRPEQVVTEALRDIFANARGRIVITLFSSHIQRIQTVFSLAKEVNRAVVISGRSLFNNIELARDHGMLHPLPELYTDQELPDLPPERLVILATGSQGESLSALARITMGEHRQLSIQEGDTVIMSSRVIPGNAQAVNRLINRMYRLGAHVFHDGVHVSGHGCQEELKNMLHAARPDVFVPIHGEFRHLVQHRELACACGVDPAHAFVLADGEPITLLADDVRLEEKIPSDPLLVDGKGIGDVGAVLLRERQLLGEAGVVVVVVLLDSTSGAIVFGPEIVSRGFVFENHFEHLLDDARKLVLEQLNGWNADTDLNRVSEHIRSVLRSMFRKVVGRDPIVLPIITDAHDARM